MTDINNHAAAAKTHHQRVASSDQFREFQMAYFETSDILKKVFKEILQEQELDTAQLLESAIKLFELKSTDADLFDNLFNLRTMDDPVFAHSMNVGLISRMFGRWLHLSPKKMDVLTLAGLLHDVGKLKMPSSIINKPGKLTPNEFEIIKTHPQLGYDLLKDQDVSVHVLNVVLQHHERCDGSGYPNHLKEDEISDYAEIVAIADVYDGMTCARKWRSPLCPFEVIETFEKDRFSGFNVKYTLPILTHLANTYMNNRVVLSDGRACTIAMINKDFLSLPIVKFDDDQVLDLSSQREIYIKSIV